MLEKILNFLQEFPGYRKEGSSRLQRVLERKNIFATKDECLIALREFNSSFGNEDLLKNEKEENFEGILKKRWFNGKTWCESFEFKEKLDNNIIDSFRNHLAKELNKEYKNHYTDKSKEKETALFTLADLHIGAMVSGMIKTKNYNTDILIKYLNVVAKEINSQNYSKVNIAILGDLIESFTGLNHINSWKQLEPGMHGAESVISTHKILCNFLSKINNLENLYIVSGNHDRVTSSNKEDVEGDVAKMIAYFIDNSLTDVNVHFNNLVLTCVIDGVSYVMHHGHKAIGKKSASEFLFEYGNQGLYNVILSGHFHSASKKELIRQVQSVRNDSQDYVDIVCPSIFTGNFYSESSGWTSTPGFMKFVSTSFGKARYEYIPLA
jgi:hypothetical protein